MTEKPSEQSIFLHAVGLASPADRAAYLEDVCRDNPPLRLEFDALIAAHDRLGVEPPPSGSELPRTIDEPTTERAWRYARAWLYHAMAGDDAEKK
jgi:hypothetical protein